MSLGATLKWEIKLIQAVLARMLQLFCHIKFNVFNRIHLRPNHFFSPTALILSFILHKQPPLSYIE